MLELDEKYEFRENTIDKLNVVDLNKNNLNLIKNNEIMFIEDSNEGTTYIMDKSMNLYYVNLKEDKRITKEDIYNVLSDYKKASYENQEVYTGINLGIGHALLIKTKIYDEYMKLLRSVTIYQDQYLDCYNAYCYWIHCAIKFLKNYDKVD